VQKNDGKDEASSSEASEEEKKQQQKAPESPKRERRHSIIMMPAKSTGSLPTFPAVPPLSLPEPSATPPSPLSSSSLQPQNSEITKLRKQVKKLKNEKSDWQKREQVLLKRIDTLETKIRMRETSDKENAMTPRYVNGSSAESTELVLREYRQIQESLRRLTTKFDSFQTVLISNGNVETNPLRSKK